MVGTAVGRRDRIETPWPTFAHPVAALEMAGGIV
jgi:hypothetical protein